MQPLTILAVEALELAEAILAPKDPRERLLQQSIDAGGEVLRKLSRKAVGRLLASNHPWHVKTHGQRLFTDDELLILAEELAAIRTTATLLARSLVAERGEKVRRRRVKESTDTGVSVGLTEGLASVLFPEDALAFFRALIPMLGLDPHFLPDMRRSAFHLAVATDTELLSAVQDAISSRIESGQVGTGPAAIDAILDAAGVSPRNPQYSDMVMRTNFLDATNNGYHEQLKREIDTFPTWRFSNPNDSRSRPKHAALNGKYFPSTVSIDQVRGATIADKANCRCVQVGIDKWSWADLKAGGARIADGYVDIAA